MGDRSFSGPRAAAAAAVALAAAIGPAHAAGPDPKGNSCLEPYWADTLRCKAFPMEAPQPNYGNAPATVGEVRDFTRVFLDKPSVRALDGTWPVVYVDKAVCTNPLGCGAGIDLGDPVDSNDWLISFTGGGSCQAADTDDDGKMDDADSCLHLYEDETERDEMGTSGKDPMKNFQGIMDDDPVANPVFAGFNRVRVEKVSYDRYLGIRKYHRKGGYFTGTTTGMATVNFDLFQQGFRVVKAALRRLDEGLEYPTWRDDGLGAVEEVTERLPSIELADRVVFVGHSGGAHGLYHNIDRLAGILAKTGDFQGDVRAIFDANFLPSISNEAAFATDASMMALGGDLYSDEWAGETSAGGIDFSYDGAAYYETGDLALQYAAWGGDKILDQSCVATHKATDGAVWKCRERIHVAANHLATPFVVREDFLDPNIEHTTQSNLGHFLAWGEFGAWPHCPLGMDCPPYFTLAEHRQRLEEQAGTLFSDHLSSEIALGIDDSLGGSMASPVFPTFYQWMPGCGTHSGAYDDDSWDGQQLTWQSVSWTMREWVEDFLAAPRTGGAERLVDGMTNGIDTAASSCPP